VVVGPATVQCHGHLMVYRYSQSMDPQCKAIQLIELLLTRHSFEDDDSFCVQSAILLALIRSPYSFGSTTAAPAAARTKARTGRRPCQQRHLQGRRNRQRQPRQQPRTTVAKCVSWRHVLASHWCRADIVHVDSIQDDAMMAKETFRN